MPAIAIEPIVSVVPVSEDCFLKTSQAAQYLNLKPDTLRSWRKAGVGPRYHSVNGRLCLYRLSDIVSFVVDKQAQGERYA